MRQPEQEQRTHTTKESSTMRGGVVAKDEGRAVAEEEREQQVELALGEGHDEQGGESVGGAVDGRGIEAVSADAEECGIDHDDPQQCDPAEAIGEDLAGACGGELSRHCSTVDEK